MSTLAKHTRLLMIRGIISVALYAVFVALGVAGVFSGNRDILFWLPIVVIVSIVALPRQTVPSVLEGDEDEATMDRLSRMRLWFSYVRLGYLMIAVFILFGLPELIS